MNQPIQIPSSLWQQLQALVDDGWASDVNQVLIEAIRRYLDTHQARLTEAFIKEDVQWGLYGEE